MSIDIEIASPRLIVRESKNVQFVKEEKKKNVQRIEKRSDERCPLHKPKVQTEREGEICTSKRKIVQ